MMGTQQKGGQSQGSSCLAPKIEVWEAEGRARYRRARGQELLTSAVGWRAARDLPAGGLGLGARRRWPRLTRARPSPRHSGARS